eukprot:CAMPEP_0168730494 /NCGR_PEP_ID=MMETSP0724-20121128/6760_1 /TAXON_ID=265536 /ORGANISM="Amphiprora sp., Strain CCMP467" /LENGTH=658 /DNA_ID=CAMNT_0008777435 /DNA_START=171 /DNA_END=2147 /DNA_ORIENTATION=-
MSLWGRVQTPNTDQDLTLLVGTANLGNAPPTLDDVRAWIPPQGRTSHVTPLPELLVQQQEQQQQEQPKDGTGGGDTTTTPIIFAKETFDLIAVGLQEATWSNQKKKKKKPKDNGDDDEGTTQELEDDKEDDVVDDDEEDDATEATDNEEEPDENNNNNNNHPEQATTTTTTTETILPNNKDMSQLASLLDTVLGDQYRPLAEKSRGQMRFVVFCRHDNYRDFTDVDVRCENTGLAHVWANKGGIVLSLTYRGTTRLSFLSAHLAAHEGAPHYAARCDNLDEILNGAKNHAYYDVALSSHHLFVLGDLNFRTRFAVHRNETTTTQRKSSSTTKTVQPDDNGTNDDDKEPPSSVDRALALVEQQDYKKLYYQHDELIAGIAKGELLVDFDTLPCNFPPTFKVLREKGFHYKPQRTPSYTDRILYRSANKQYLKPLAYEPCPDFATSDHKPLRGAYAITPNAVLTRQFRQTEPPGSYRIAFSQMACRNLPALDVTGTSDPYIMLTWEFVDVLATDREHKNLLMRWTSSGDRKWPKTQFLSRTLNPTFTGEELELSINGPVPAEALLFITVMDYDLHSADDLMCALPINFRDLVGGDQVRYNKHNRATIQYTDKPLLHNGKYSGTITVTIDITKSNQPNPEINGQARKKEGGLLKKLMCRKQ